MRVRSATGKFMTPPSVTVLWVCAESDGWRDTIKAQLMLKTAVQPSYNNVYFEVVSNPFRHLKKTAVEIRELERRGPESGWLSYRSCKRHRSRQPAYLVQTDVRQHLHSCRPRRLSAIFLQYTVQAYGQHKTHQMVSGREAKTNDRGTEEGDLSFEGELQANKRISCDWLARDRAHSHQRTSYKTNALVVTYFHLWFGLLDAFNCAWNFEKN